MHFINIVQFVVCVQFALALPNPIGKYDIIAPKDENENTRFFVIGDWGGIPIFPYDTPSEVAVAKSMGKLGAQLNTSFQMALGDNFYYHGVQSITDPRFQNTFEKVFTADSLQTPWYVLAGNHDHYGNASAQVEYTKVSKRWKFPDFFYTFTLWQNGGQKKLVDFIMLDTVLLCGGGNISDWEDTPIEGPENAVLAETYWQWIEEQLRSSNAPYVLLAGHFPVYSVAEHGPTKCLVDRLRPLLIQYKATAYLCGHDHNLQHLSETVNGTQVDYFVVGAGDIVEGSQKHASNVPAGSLKYFWGPDSLLGGFGLVEVNSTLMTVSFIEHGEKTLYRALLQPRAL